MRAITIFHLHRLAGSGEIIRKDPRHIIPSFPLPIAHRAKAMTHRLPMRQPLQQQLRCFSSSVRTLEQCTAKFPPNRPSASILRHLHFTKPLPYTKGQAIQTQFQGANLQFKSMQSKIGRKRREMDEKNLVMNEYEAELLANIVAMKPSPMLLSFQFNNVFTGGRREKGKVTEEDIKKMEEVGYEYVQASRGGEITFHNEGQLVAYPVLDLKDFDGLTVKCFVSQLEDAIISTMAHFGLKTKKTENTGVWVDDNTKISSIGLSVSRGITTHGISINVCNEIPSIERAGVVFCGLPGKTQTTMSKELGHKLTVDEVATQFAREFAKKLGITQIESVDLEDLEID